MDRLQCMAVFVRVVEQGAFARAADDLGLSRASVTAAIAQLEQRLGVRLINRTTRRLSLTDEGKGYYQACVRLLGEVAEAEDNLSGTRLAPRGKLRVTVPQSFVSDAFYPALAEFTQRYPDLEVEVVLTDRAVNLIEEGIDCALRCVEIPTDSALVARRLCPTRWLTCASPAYLASAGCMPRSLDDLGQHNCIRFVSPSTGRARDWEFEVDGERRIFVPHGNLFLTSLDAAIFSAIAGGGIAQVPDVLAFPAVLDGRLTPLLTDVAASAPSIMLVYPGNRYLTAKVRAFADFFARVFPSDGWWPLIAGKGVSAADGRAHRA